ncbi:putative exported protein [Pseudomonas batumici]|uniref:Putative exported protein n=1 Tax=Pseudomonas batumici TaxID=226910 RepID=A0A0C2I7C9_9PSED|nr:putative exported protein [Pseudomonas batumici]
MAGGIGQDESKALLQTQGYNLHLVFSTGSGNKYLSDVDVLIQSEKGDALLSLNQVGPILYVQLPANKYRVVAKANGHEERRTVALNGKSIDTVNIHWSD